MSTSIELFRCQHLVKLVEDAYIGRMSFHVELRDWLGLTALSLLVAIGVYSVVAAAPHSKKAAKEERALASFAKMVTVLQSPRCMNCHRSDVPRVRDTARHHVPRVEPGKDGSGIGGLRCVICHRASNNKRSRIPGAVGWQQAPYSMSWDGLSAAEICDNLKDRSMNGDRGLDDLKGYFEHDHLVQWAWKPGQNRSKPPLAYEDFLAHVARWVDAGGPCPKILPTTETQ